MRAPAWTATLLSIPALAAPACSAGPPDAASTMSSEPRQKILVAHRGASAYAPEHTLEAYRLAIEQGADFIEPDLQITRDGVLICLHDLTLERTTDVEEVFPDRYREEEDGGRALRRWYASDFTLDEIRRLDAGSWFDARFRGARVPTLDEAVELALGAAGIFPETKAPEVYGERGFEMERLLVEKLEEYGLHEPRGVSGTPVVVQSFSPASLRILRHDLGSELDLTLLVSAPDREGWLTPEGLRRAAEFATGVGPAKRLVLDRPDVVRWAHETGLTVVPYTFRSRAPGDFASGTAEQAHYLYELGVDGLFTDNPDHFPRTPPGEGS